jgi:hypothetical protein
MVMPSRISPGYFDTARIRLLRGRPFTDADADAPVAIIDELTAEVLFLGNRDPVGAEIQLSSQPLGPLIVVGVVGNVSRAGPERLAGAQLYRPKPSNTARGSQFLVRTSAPAATIIPVIQESLQRALPPGSAAPRVRSIEEDFNQLTAGRRTNATIMSLFGLIVLLVGGSGVYAVMASTVAQQQRELGVRVALGATRARIMRTVLGRAAVYLTIGLAVGLAAGRALSTMFASMLFEVRPGDVSTYAMTTLGKIANGFTGPSQWEPGVVTQPDYGPSTAEVLRSFQRYTAEDIDIDYPMAQAYAGCLVVQRCIETVRSLDQAALRHVAGELDFTTFYGRYRIDPRTGRQLGHVMPVVQWQQDGKAMVWPPEMRQQPLLLP